jgi:hypothetical protein
MKLDLDEQGNIKVDIYEVIDQFTDEQKQELARHVIVDEGVLMHYADVLTKEFCGPNYNPAIYNARLRLIEQLPQAGREVIRTLMREVKQAQAEKGRAEQWAWKMYHAWPKEPYTRTPDMPKFMFQPFVTDAEALALVKDPEAREQLSAGLSIAERGTVEAIPFPSH